MCKSSPPRLCSDFLASSLAWLSHVHGNSADFSSSDSLITHASVRQETNTGPGNDVILCVQFNFNLQYHLPLQSCVGDFKALQYTCSRRFEPDAPSVADCSPCKPPDLSDLPC